jgi:hypothetical protein
VAAVHDNPEKKNGIQGYHWQSSGIILHFTLL